MSVEATNGRLTFRTGGIAAALACALLVACGGGGGTSSGGGGGIITPPTPTMTPTPVTTPTTGPVGATSVSTTAPLSTSNPTAITLGAVSNGSTTVVSSASIHWPAASASGTKLSTTMSSKAPANVTAPQGHVRLARHPAAFGVQSTLVYFTVSVSAGDAIASVPGFTITLPASAGTGNWYLFYLDPNSAGSGWQEVTQLTPTGIVLTSALATFAPPLNFAGNATYYFAIATTQNAIPTPSPAPTTSPATSTATLPPVASFQHAGWAPYEVANAFEFPVQSGYNGNGQTVVVIGDNPPLSGDLANYRSFFQLSGAGSGSYKVVRVGSSGWSTSDSGGLGEATLDVETIMGLAPGANIEFYWIPNLSFSTFVQAYQLAMQDPAKPQIFSMSFGGCEDPTTSTEQDTVLAQGAAANIAFVASSGDQGDECYRSTGYVIGVNSPASDPNVIGVGGNETFDPPTVGGAPSLTNTAVWNDKDFFGPDPSNHNSTQGASGGGLSVEYGAPTYQQGLAGADATHRSVPDVAMPAVNVPVYLQGGWSQYGGTSWGAPQMAAMLAGIDQYCGGSLGANPIQWLYEAYSLHHTNFLDIITGTNKFGTDVTYYAAGSGYDKVSGLGIPYGMSVAQAVCPGGILLGRATAQARTSVLPVDAYGEAHDTEMPAASRYYVQDLGMRSSSAASEITVILRATPTVALDEAKVIDALRGAGFTISQTYANHLVVVASAPASAIDAYFRTELHDVSQGARGVRYANLTPAIVPAAVAPYVKGVTLNNLDVYTRL